MDLRVRVVAITVAVSATVKPPDARANAPVAAPGAFAEKGNRTKNQTAEWRRPEYDVETPPEYRLTSAVPAALPRELP